MIPPVRTHHLDSTVTIVLYLFPSLQTVIHLPDPSDFFDVLQTAVDIATLCLKTFLCALLFFFMQSKNCSYQLPSASSAKHGVRHLPCISWFDSDSNPVWWGAMTTLIVQGRNTEAQRTRTTANSYLVLPMGHAWCQGLSMNYLL